MPDIPQFVLDRARQDEPIFTADEVLRWPAGLLEQLVANGVLKPTKTSNTVSCDACCDDHVETVTYIESPQGTPLRAYIACQTAGRVRVDLDRLRQWAVDRQHLPQFNVENPRGEHTDEDRFLFRQDGGTWLVQFRRERGSFQSMDGMGYISRLLEQGRKRFTAEQLRHLVKVTTTISAKGPTCDVSVTDDTTQNAVDRETVRQCRERLENINLEYQAAREAADTMRLEDLEEEEHQIGEYLAKSTDVRGGPRRLADKSRSRFNSVKQAIERALGHLEDAQPPLPQLAIHLRESIKWENRSFVYEPGPDMPTWNSPLY